MERLVLEPNREPTALFVKPVGGYQLGAPAGAGPGEFELQDREEFYRSTHAQTIAFQAAREVVAALVGDSRVGPTPDRREWFRLQSRHQLFPQVLRVVVEYMEKKVELHGADPRELGQELYMNRMVSRLVDAIEPDDSEGEPPLMPVLNRYKPMGTTAEVDFKTVRPCKPVWRSHVNQVVLDSPRWESSTCFRLEQATQAVACYARNDHLGFVVPYDYAGVSRGYEPDFLVRLRDQRTLILEIKGYETDEDLAKHQAAHRWVKAVNNWGRLGRWAFHVCRDPQRLHQELAGMVRGQGSWMVGGRSLPRGEPKRTSRIEENAFLKKMRSLVT